MPKGVYNRSNKVAQPSSLAAGNDAMQELMSQIANKQTFGVDIPPVAPVAAAPEPVKMFPVKLTYNYVPFGHYEAIGWDKPAVTRKNAVGQEVVVEKAEFIKGEIAPAPYPGVGFAGKVWKGSTIGLPIAEARTLISSRRAERADDIPAA